MPIGLCLHFFIFPFNKTPSESHSPTYFYCSFIAGISPFRQEVVWVNSNNDYAENCRKMHWRLLVSGRGQRMHEICRKILWCSLVLCWGLIWRENCRKMQWCSLVLCRGLRWRENCRKIHWRSLVSCRGLRRRREIYICMYMANCSRISAIYACSLINWSEGNECMLFFSHKCTCGLLALQTLYV